MPQQRSPVQTDPSRRWEFPGRRRLGVAGSAAAAQMPPALRGKMSNGDAAPRLRSRPLANVGAASIGSWTLLRSPRRAMHPAAEQLRDPAIAASNTPGGIRIQASCAAHPAIPHNPRSPAQWAPRVLYPAAHRHSMPSGRSPAVRRTSRRRHCDARSIPGCVLCRPTAACRRAAAALKSMAEFGARVPAKDVQLPLLVRLGRASPDRTTVTASSPSRGFARSPRHRAQ